MKTELTKEEVIAEKRERIPIHSARDVIALRGLDHDNFYYRFIKVRNPERVQRFLEAGYEFVQKGGQRIVGDKNVGSTESIGSFYTTTGKDGETLILVALPLELWQGDQVAKEDRIRELEDTQYRNLQGLMDPRSGGSGHIGAHPAINSRMPPPVINGRRR